MKGKYSFREPLGKDPNGLYITAAQMQFFLNRQKGQENFLEGDPSFFKYYYKCAVYNVIWDLVEKDPDCASFFWDEDNERIGVTFPVKGKLVKEFKTKNIDYTLYSDEEELD